MHACVRVPKGRIACTEAQQYKIACDRQIIKNEAQSNLKDFG